MKKVKYTLTSKLVMSFFFLILPLNLLAQSGADLTKELIKREFEIRKG